MNQIQRQVFSPQFPRQVSTSAVRRSLVLAPYKTEPSPSLTFTTNQLLAVFCTCLNESILTVFLKKNTGFTLRVIKAIVEDHERENSRLVKDLQLNLLSNLIVQFTRSAGLPEAKQFNHAEELVRLCELDPAFKLEVKKALFDRQALQCKHLMLHPYHA